MEKIDLDLIRWPSSYFLEQSNGLTKETTE